MRVIVLSDSHGAANDVRTILETYRGEAGAWIHLGDGMEEWESMQRQFPELPLYSVCGNCDAYSHAPESLLLTLDGFRIFCTHGNRYSVKHSLDPLAYAAEEQQAQIALYGHTHIARQDEIGGVTLLNPGSVRFTTSTPRGYLVLDLLGKNFVPSFCAL